MPALLGGPCKIASTWSQVKLVSCRTALQRYPLTSTPKSLCCKLCVCLSANSNLPAVQGRPETQACHSAGCLASQSSGLQGAGQDRACNPPASPQEHLGRCDVHLDGGSHRPEAGTRGPRGQLPGAQYELSVVLPAQPCILGGSCSCLGWLPQSETLSAEECFEAVLTLP